MDCRNLGHPSPHVFNWKSVFIQRAWVTPFSTASTYCVILQTNHVVPPEKQLQRFNWKSWTKLWTLGSRAVELFFKYFNLSHGINQPLTSAHSAIWVTALGFNWLEILEQKSTILAWCVLCCQLCAPLLFFQNLQFDELMHRQYRNSSCADYWLVVSSTGNNNFHHVLYSSTVLCWVAWPQL